MHAVQRRLHSLFLQTAAWPRFQYRAALEMPNSTKWLPKSYNAQPLFQHLHQVRKHGFASTYQDVERKTYEGKMHESTSEKPANDADRDSRMASDAAYDQGHVDRA